MMLRWLSSESGFSNPYERGKYMLIWKLNLFFILVFSFLCVITFILQTTAFYYYSVVLVVSSGGFVYLRKTKNYRALFWAFTVSATCIVNLSLHRIPDTLHYPDFFWIMAVVILAFIGLGKRVGIAFMLIHSVSILYFFVMAMNQNIGKIRPQTGLELAGIIIELFFALAVIGFVISQFIGFQQHAIEETFRANDSLTAQNETIRRKNAEHVVLMKEIHHRVKNNLQIITSLLRMQAHEVRSDEAREHLDEAINRVMAMSLIHRNLYEFKELSSIRPGNYIKELVLEILRSNKQAEQRIDLVFSGEIPVIGMKTIVPLGLIINELVTNSLKHAFRELEYGEIMIRLRQAENRKFELIYRDNGAWKLPDSQRSHFGLELIDLLTQQLDGEVVQNGSAFHFTLTNTDLD